MNAVIYVLETTKNKISNAKKGIGRPHHAETCQKISAANKGKKKPPVTALARANMAAAQIGRQHSAETKEKMATARKRYWAKMKESQHA